LSGTTVAGETLERLRAVVAAEGEAIAPAVSESGGDILAPLVIATAAAGADADEYALVMESVLEGYLLHFGRPRIIETPDPDLRLLAGDYMYALGLSRLAALGDLDAVRALADLITLSARHHAEGGEGAELAEDWCRVAAEMGGGGSVGLEARRALIAFRQAADTASHT
jgi:hypothetical protein